MNWKTKLTAELEKETADAKTIRTLDKFWADDSSYSQDELTGMVALADAIATKFNLA